jgi:hypothetical protein
LYARAVGCICTQTRLVKYVMNKKSKNSNSNCIVPESCSTPRFFHVFQCVLRRSWPNFSMLKIKLFIWQDLQVISPKCGQFLWHIDIKVVILLKSSWRDKKKVAMEVFHIHEVYESMKQIICFTLTLEEEWWRERGGEQDVAWRRRRDFTHTDHLVLFPMLWMLVLGKKKVKACGSLWPNWKLVSPVNNCSILQ